MTTQAKKSSLKELSKINNILKAMYGVSIDESAERVSALIQYLDADLNKLPGVFQDIPEDGVIAADIAQYQNSDKEDGKEGFNGFIISVIRCYEVDLTGQQVLAKSRSIYKHLKKSNTYIFVFEHRDEDNRLTHISIALPARRQNKIERSKLVTEKFSLLYKISLEAPLRSHIEILYNIKSKSNADKLLSWLQGVDVDALSSGFYNEILNWYDSVYKSITDKKDDIVVLRKKSNFLLSFISRMLFVWFLKKKGLVNKALFEIETLDRIFSHVWKEEDGTSIYEGLLENLFYQTLNDESRFSKPEPLKEGVLDAKVRILGNQAISDSKYLGSLLAESPYVNGGLFEQEGHSFKLKNKFIIEALPKSAQDRSKALINIFNRYVFTVNETTAFDQQVELNPELLGNAFENLLGYVDPAHKDVKKERNVYGNFFTPRDIVDHMNTNCMRLFLIEKFSDDNKISDELISSIIDPNRDILPTIISGKTRKKLFDIISKVKILEPAVGSGSFSMGMLHLLVNIHEFLDPDGSFIKRILSGTNEQNTIQFHRKLFIIQNNLFGVDILHEAAAIARLRFFISLAIEQKVDPSKINRGFSPLPNLEMKIVAANTLTSLGNLTASSESGDRLDLLSDQLCEISSQFLLEHDQGKKNSLKQKHKLVRQELAQLVKEIEKISQKKRLKDSLQKEKKPLESKLRNKKKEISKINQKIHTSIEILDENIDPIEESSRLVEQYRKAEIDLSAINKKYDLLIQDSADENYLDWDEYKKLAEKDKENSSSQISSLLANWDPFDSAKSAGFFDPRYMFGLNKLFDIVHGNPPYSLVKKSEISNQDEYPYSLVKNSSDKNLYCIFMEKSINLLTMNGVNSFIVQESLMTDQSKQGSRELLFSNVILDEIIHFTKESTNQPFKGATVGTVIYTCVKKQGNKTDGFRLATYRNLNNFKSPPNLEQLTIKDLEELNIFTGNNLCIPLIKSKAGSRLLKKLAIILVKKNNLYTKLSHYAISSSQGDTRLGKKLDPLVINTLSSDSELDEMREFPRLMRGDHLAQYNINLYEPIKKTKVGLCCEYLDISKTPTKARKDFQDRIEKNQLFSHIISGHVTGTTDRKRIRSAVALPSKRSTLWVSSVDTWQVKDQTTAYALTAILNSSFIDWLFRHWSTNNNVPQYQLERLLMPNFEEERELLKDLAKLSESSHKRSTDKTERYEYLDFEEQKKIDKLVFKAYDMNSQDQELISTELEKFYP